MMEKIFKIDGKNYSDVVEGAACRSMQVQVAHCVGGCWQMRMPGESHDKPVTTLEFIPLQRLHQVVCHCISDSSCLYNSMNHGSRYLITMVTMACLNELM